MIERIIRWWIVRNACSRARLQLAKNLVFYHDCHANLFWWGVKCGVWAARDHRGCPPSVLFGLGINYLPMFHRRRYNRGGMAVSDHSPLWWHEKIGNENNPVMRDTFATGVTTGIQAATC